MRTKQRLLAREAFTEITCAPSTLDNGERSPEKVGRLLARCFDGKMFREILDDMRGVDREIYRALLSLKGSHTYAYRYLKDEKRYQAVVNWPEAEATWQIVMDLLGRFRDQLASQELVPRDEARSQMREAVEIFRKLAAQ